MKNVLLVIATIMFAILFSGCGAKQPIPKETEMNSLIYSKIIKKDKTFDVKIAGFISKTKNTTKKENISIAILSTVNVGKKLGFNKFMIKGIPPYINSTEDIINYSMPKLNNEDTSLEEKTTSLVHQNIKDAVSAHFRISILPDDYPLPCFDIREIEKDKNLESFFLQTMKDKEMSNTYVISTQLEDLFYE